MVSSDNMAAIVDPSILRHIFYYSGSFDIVIHQFEFKFFWLLYSLNGYFRNIKSFDPKRD